MTRGQHRSFTDADLRSDLKAGLKPSEIAKKRSVSRQAVYKRVNQLGLTTTAAVVAPAESKRFVRQSINAQEQLLKGIEKANLLMDACDRYLRDPDNDEQYDVGPRTHEVTVTYEVELMTSDGKLRRATRKRKLSEIMSYVEDVAGERVCGWVNGETKVADPRDTILRTMQEARSTVTAAADLARMLADAKAMETFRNAMLVEIAKVSPEVANNIADAVRRSIILSGAADGLTGIPA